MTTSEISARCIRELKNSKNMPMLRIAWRYFVLFREQMFRKGVPVITISKIDETVRMIYSAKKQQFQ